MATIPILCERGDLIKIDAVLGLSVQERRLIYATPRAFGQFATSLPNIEAQWKPKVTAPEQVDALIATFCSGEEFAHDTNRGNGGDFKRIKGRSNGIWELKTDDVRIFGWFYKKDVFIASEVVDANILKQMENYTAYAEQAVRQRDALELNEPKFIGGESAYDVVTNYFDS
ncbi:hypothetical protein [Asticcacaulis sp. EMRT-3]|uniref:hypothetical protein n=1 Tax=Asticcacaulis sp. EMRT-3 TaxID=3040349 RepID=UPI0024AF0895|nr:hypothetical protein [Asticcacaulis sp. EMRT-3]MDI7775022.1 hypothetical protein [Asticcacaulis sp. EMRT-3]